MRAFARCAPYEGLMFLVAVALADASVDESGGSLTGEKVSGPLAHPVQAGIEAHSRRQASGESRSRSV